MESKKTYFNLNILLKQVQTSGLDERKRLENELWFRMAGNGSPLIREQEDGQYQMTFLYHSQDAKTIKLISGDLYEKNLDEQGKRRKFDRIPGTDTYILQIDNVPPKTCATYSLKVNGRTAPDPVNKKPVTMYQFDIEKQLIIHSPTSSIQLPGATLPNWYTLEPGTQINGSVQQQEKFQDSAKLFPERDVWIYKSANFDPKNGKVIFMLDGEHLCKTITPYVDTMSNKKDNPFSNTAIVFINPGQYNSGPPGRVKEYYFERDNFSEVFAEQIIPKYCSELGVENKNNVILAAHSLAAHPFINIASKHPKEVGGVVLLSPALNLNKEVEVPSKLPIFIQIGVLEDEKPSSVRQVKEDLQNKSSLESNLEFHAKLSTNNSSLRVHSSGHSEPHVIDGMEKGLQFIRDSQLSHSKVSNVTLEYKSELNKRKSGSTSKANDESQILTSSQKKT